MCSFHSRNATVYEGTDPPHSYSSINNLYTTLNKFYPLNKGNLETFLSNTFKVRVYLYDGQIQGHRKRMSEL
jgi:hypothetical protein